MLSIYFAIRFDFVLDEFENNYVEEKNYVTKSEDCILLVMTCIYFMKRNKWNRTATQVKQLNKVAMNLKKWTWIVIGCSAIKP